MATKPGIRGALKAPNAAQARTMRDKVNVPTEHYDDITGDQHDVAFVVAGAMKADLLADFHEAINRATGEGKSRQWFRQEFERIANKNGWTGFTGDGTKTGRAWRADLIYETNMRASMEAARWAELHDPDIADACPYVRFRHRSIMNARDEHKAWDGMVLRRDDPWFLAHQTPMGYHCKCTWEPVSDADLRRMGKAVPDRPPPFRTHKFTDRDGVVHLLPEGVQHGWSRWKPGEKNSSRPTQLAQVLAHRIGRLDATPEPIARANVLSLVQAEVFARFYRRALAAAEQHKKTGKRPGSEHGEFPVAVLRGDDMKALDAQSPVVLLSHESLAEHLVKHPEIGLADYRKIQRLLDNASSVWRTNGEGERLLYVTIDGVKYLAALKRTRDGKKNYFLSLYLDKRKGEPPNAVRIR